LAVGHSLIPPAIFNQRHHKTGIIAGIYLPGYEGLINISGVSGGGMDEFI